MLSQMREGRFIRTVLWVTAVAFIISMIFVWGADYQGTGCDNKAPQGQQWIGKVGDVGLSLREFDQRYRQGISQLAQGRQAGQVIGEDERLRLFDQIFDQMVNETLFRIEVERLGLMPTDDEVAEVLQFNPPDVLKQQFVDEEGNFDRSAYQVALNNPNIDWRPYEQFVRASLPGKRLQQIVTSSIHVGEGDARAEFERKYRKAKVQYAGQSWREVTLDPEDPGDDVLTAFFVANQADYMETEGFRIDAVKFTRDPSEADEAYVLGRVEFIRDEILGGKSFERMARDYSQDPSNADQGGDLGWFGRGRMVPEFDEAVFALEEGGISEPVKTRFGYHLIKAEAMRTQNDIEEVNARHILLRLEPSFATMDSIGALADTLVVRARETGSLKDSGADLEVTVLSPPPYFEYTSIEGIGYSNAVKQRVRRMEIGEISHRFQAHDADYLVQLLEKLPEAPAEFASVRDRVLRDWQQQEKQRIAREKVESLKLLIDAGGDMETAAAELSLTSAVTDSFTRQDYIPDIGPAGPFQMAAMMMNVGDLSGVIETDQGAYVLKVLEKIDSEKTLFFDEHDDIVSNLKSTYTQLYFEGWMEGLQERYQVEDFRDLFYN
jgi:peptidyl-prolyl cis-trans isomerase D